MDGIAFSSKREADAYSVLKLRERAGEITDLRLQPRYRLIVNDCLVCTYVADFSWTENGTSVCADAKGVLTAVFKLKRKLLFALTGIEILLL